MFSMTGYGRAVLSEDGREVTVEIKSVNHRYLDLGFKTGKYFSFLEDRLRRAISSKLSRGHLDIYINYRNMREDYRQVRVDYALLQSYVDAFREAEKIGLPNDLTLTAAMRFNDVLTVEEAEDNQEVLSDLVERACLAALDELCAMRKTEGEKLKKDILIRLDTITRQLGFIEERAPQVVSIYREKLSKRIEELLDGQDIDQTKLSTEVAFFADKCNIDEEIVRLKSHIHQFLTTMEAQEAIGRKLDFIIQEINREINTIGSKASDVEITNNVLLMKNEVEKIREQIQNIE